MSQKYKIPHNSVMDQRFYQMVAEWLKTLRHNSGFSLEKAAEVLGWRPEILEEAETTGIINAAQLSQVARAYSLDHDIAVGQVLKLYLASLMEIG